MRNCLLRFAIDSQYREFYGSVQNNHVGRSASWTELRENSQTGLYGLYYSIWENGPHTETGVEAHLPRFDPSDDFPGYN